MEQNVEVSSTVRYIISSNGRLLFDPETKNAMVMHGKDIKNTYEDYQIDDRLTMVSIDNTYDAQEYMNYYVSYLTLLNRNCRSTDAKGYLVNHLDMGFIPFIIPPTFLMGCEEFKVMAENLKERLDKCNIRRINLAPYRFDNTGVNSKKTDVWVSRIDAAKFLGCGVEGVRFQDLFRRLMKC